MGQRDPAPNSLLAALFNPMLFRVYSPTEIEPCALGVTVICLILNKISEKHASQASSLWTLCPAPTCVPARVGEDVEDMESDLGISWWIG